MLPTYSPLIILVGLGLDIVAFAIHRLTGLKLQGMPLTMFAFQMWIMGYIFRCLMIGWVDNAPPSASLQNRFRQLVDCFRLAGIQLKTSSGKNVNALISRKTVYITQTSLEHLSDEGVDWIIGHELTHQKFFDLQSGDSSDSVKLKVRTVVFALCLLGISLRLDFSFWTLIIAFLAITAIIALLASAFRTGRDYVRDIELACDYVSMVQLKSAAGAVEALQAMKHFKKSSDPSSYPTKDERMRQAREYAEGLPRTPYSNVKVEAGVVSILAELK